MPGACPLRNESIIITASYLSTAVSFPVVLHLGTVSKFRVFLEQWFQKQSKVIVVRKGVVVALLASNICDL